jgi:RNA polymerase sigma-70 factor, ECF subfamily
MLLFFPSPRGSLRGAEAGGGGRSNLPPPGGHQPPETHARDPRSLPVTLTAPPEPALTDAAAAPRDPCAFEALYRAHYRHVYAITLRMTCDPARAEEVTQEVFVRVWQKLPGFRGESALGTWIHTVAVRTTLEHLRSESRREARVMTTDEPDRYAAEARRAMPDTAVDLERAIAALPPGARSVLLMHDVNGYRYHEIAEMLGVSLGTVKSQLNRARRLMMEALER